MGWSGTDHPLALKRVRNRPGPYQDADKQAFHSHGMQAGQLTVAEAACMAGQPSRRTQTLSAPNANRPTLAGSNPEA